MGHDEIVLRLRDRRRRLPMTQRALAAALDIPKSCVSEWESGATRPRADNLARWADALGLRLALVPKESPWTS